jgi:hypothetical protein
MPGNNNNTDQILAEIDTLLQSFKQSGGDRAVLDEINSLISEYKGEEVTLSEEDAMALAQNGGAKRRAAKAKGKKKSKSKSKSKGKKKAAKKSKSKSKSKGKKKSKSKSKGKKRAAPKRAASKRKTASKSKSKGKRKTASKGKRKAVVKRAASKGKVRKAKSKSRSKSRGRKMKREEGDAKPKRKMNPKFAAAQELRKHVMSELGDELSPLAVGALTSAIWKLLKANDTDAEKAKKAFKKEAFVADYNTAKKAQAAKKAAKKAAKQAASH